MKSGLIIFNTLAVTLRTDDAGHWTQDAGHCPPTTLYYKLTGELKKQEDFFLSNNMFSYKSKFSFLGDLYLLEYIFI